MVSRPLIFLSVGLLALVAAVSVVIMNAQSVPTPAPSSSPTEITIKGNVVCLPHKDRSGPVTLECAYGIQADSGVYYGLDTTLFPSSLTDIPMGDAITVNGKVTSLDQLPDKSLEKYDIAGVILIRTLEREE